MNTQTHNALKMAIDKLENHSGDLTVFLISNPHDELIKKEKEQTIEAIQACKEALAQPAQEPVAFVWLERDEVMPILELHGYTLTSSMYYFLDDLFSKIAEKNTHPAPSCSCKDKK